jgi:uncharacterized membrane protein YgcG
MLKRFVQMAMLILLCFLFTYAEQPKPMSGTYIHDFANVISADSKTQLQEKAKQLKEKFKTEIAFVTIDSLNGEDQLDYSVKMMRDWGISSPDNSIKGILILVAVQDRKTSFRTSRHIEGEFPDSVTGNIQRQMDAYFKNNDFGGGLLLGLTKISERLEQVYIPQNKQQTKSGNKVWLWVLLGCTGIGGLAFLFIWRSRQRVREAERELERKRALTVAETRKNYFAMEKLQSRQTGQKTRQNRLARQEAKQKRKEAEREARKLRRDQTQASAQSSYTSPSLSSSYEPNSSSSYNSDYNNYNDYSSSSSYDSGSSSDSGSVYSGGSDCGGGGSDSSW